MKQLTIIVLAAAMTAFAYANEPGATTEAAKTAATPVKVEATVGKKIAAEKISKEAQQKCKSEHKGDKKAYMACLKSSK